MSITVIRATSKIEKRLFLREKRAIWRIDDVRKRLFLPEKCANGFEKCLFLREKRPKIVFLAHTLLLKKRVFGVWFRKTVDLGCYKSTSLKP